MIDSRRRRMMPKPVKRIGVKASGVQQVMATERIRRRLMPKPVRRVAAKTCSVQQVLTIVAREQTMTRID